MTSPTDALQGDRTVRGKLVNDARTLTISKTMGHTLNDNYLVIGTTQVLLRKDSYHRIYVVLSQTDHDLNSFLTSQLYLQHRPR